MEENIKSIALHGYEVNALRELLKWCHGYVNRGRYTNRGNIKVPSYLTNNLSVLQKVVQQADDQSYVGS